MTVPQTPEEAAELHARQQVIVAGAPRGRVQAERRKMQILMGFRLAFAAEARRRLKVAA